ncbi:MAG: aldo/keto reductase [Flavobacteriales bacterium]|nr:aldo/keto reductase [Flavobacteriales bacterium]MBP9079846.1 aldo/keto reductase [Flavobacteriales bacterium]
MLKRTLGHSGLLVAPFAFGGNVLGWTADEAMSFKLLDAFIDGGFNLIDTADSYSNWAPGHVGGESEALLGKWMQVRRRRHQVLVATKVGGDMGEGKNLRKAYVLRAVEASLRRLRTDHIDLYQTHWDDPGTPIGETLEALDLLVQAGKVRSIGASNYSPVRLAESLNTSKEKGLATYVSLQPRYNLFSREEFETQYAPLCAAHGLGVLTYYSLASGFLTGKYRTEADFGQSVRGTSMPKYLTPRGLKILDGLDAVCQRHGATPAAVALAWLMARPHITAPIASATSMPQLKELMAAAELRLGTEDMALLEEASAWDQAP